jgi:RNA polymerase sigma-70 factor (ECF subfamily)
MQNMSGERSHDDVVRLAVAGDRAALDGLLATYYPRLAAHIAPKLPADLRGTLTVEDVLQEAFLDVFQTIADARADCGKSFYSWLVAIVEHQMLDLIRAARAAQRGGGWSPVHAQSSSILALLEQVAVTTRTPSSSAAGHEAILAIQSALELLPEDYRRVVRLRYIEELTVAETAARMKRTEAAVEMLCHRALKQLATLMGSESRFFSRKA